MRVTSLLLAVVLIAAVLDAHAMIRQPVTSHEQPVKYTKRGTEYYIDPVGPASSIYSTLLTVGGENFRLIMVRY